MQCTYLWYRAQRGRCDSMTPSHYAALTNWIGYEVSKLRTYCGSLDSSNRKQPWGRRALYGLTTGEGCRRESVDDTVSSASVRDQRVEEVGAVWSGKSGPLRGQPQITSGTFLADACQKFVDFSMRIPQEVLACVIKFRRPWFILFETTTTYSCQHAIGLRW